MRDKLEKLLEAYAELERKMVDPAIVSDPKEYARIAKEHANQSELASKAREYLASGARLPQGGQMGCGRPVLRASRLSPFGEKGGADRL